MKKDKIKNIIINSFLSFLIIILSLGLFLKFNYARVVVSGPSMYPTLLGDSSLGYEYGYTDRFLYKFKGIERFDIVVVRVDKKSDDTLWIKRVIAMPNESIQIIDGYVYINDEKLLSDTYCQELINNPGNASEKINLGEGEYFVMGDNRNHSSDSRGETLGIVSKKQIYGHGFISRGYCKDLTCKKIISKHDYESK